MFWKIPVLVLALAGITLIAFPARADFTVMCWNVCRSTSGVEDGENKAAGIIATSGADVVLLQESYFGKMSNFPDQAFSQWMVEKLVTMTGEEWTFFQSGNGRNGHLAILVKGSVEQSFDYSNWHGTGATVKLHDGTRLNLWSCWVDYRFWITDFVDENPDASADAIEANERQSGREKQTRELLDHIDKLGQFDTDIPLIIGGDWNAPSSLDWKKIDGAKARQHNRDRDVVFAGDELIRARGLTDSFRVIHPDPVAVPGKTWSPAFHTEDQLEERIDRIYTKGAIRATAAYVLPKVAEGSGTPWAKLKFPSDHKAVVVRYTTTAAEPTAP